MSTRQNMNIILLITLFMLFISPEIQITKEENSVDFRNGTLIAQPKGGGWKGGRNRGPRPDLSKLTAPLHSKTEKEKRILAVLDDMDKNQGKGMMNVPKRDGRLLRVLAESINAKNIVEIGTSNGYSAIWFCLALSTTGGKLTTFEIDKERAELARKNFKKAGVDKIVLLIEGDAHEEISVLKEKIDILFLDADKSGYIDYLNKLLPLVKPGGMIVAHNVVSQRRDMAEYIKAVTTNPNLETIYLNTEGTGVGVTLKKR